MNSNISAFDVNNPHVKGTLVTLPILMDKLPVCAIVHKSMHVQYPRLVIFKCKRIGKITVPHDARVVMPVQVIIQDLNKSAPFEMCFSLGYIMRSVSSLKSERDKRCPMGKACDIF